MDFTENDLENIEPINEMQEEKRRAIIGNEVISIRKKIIRREDNDNLSASEKYSASFTVPTVNKNLKKIAKEELKNDDNILAVLASLSCAFALADNEQTFMKVPEPDSYCLYLRCGILIFSSCKCGRLRFQFLQV